MSLASGLDEPFRTEEAAKNAVHLRKADEPSHCNFYVERKRRFCRFPKNGSQYCIEHSFVLKDSDSRPIRKRIICPLDAKHSVYEDELTNHMKKCNSRLELRPCCYKADMNCGEDEGSDPAHYEVTLRTAEEREVMEMVVKCEQLHAEHIGKLKKEVLFHEIMREEFENPKNGAAAHKHILQQASLIGHMDRLGFLADHHCYMEFGCGKGGLSHWVQQSVKDNSDTQFILVDKSSVRYKMDNHHRGKDQGPHFERIKIDIQHLDIQAVPNILNDRRVITIGKHLCGSATDLMLRCLTQLNPDTKHKREVGGVVLALCCHHRCHWKSYVGKEFMQRECGLTARQFHILCSISSWATCASKPVNPETIQDSPYTHARSGNLLPQQREIIGNQCKQLIDLGRCKYLEGHGFTAELVAFIDKEYTLEDVCLLARRPPHSEVSADSATPYS